MYAPDPAISCGRKHRYETRQQAWRALLTTQRRKHRRQARKSQAYWCNQCGYFHHGRISLVPRIERKEAPC